MKPINHVFLNVAAGMLLAFGGCKTAAPKVERYYSAADFAKTEKIDIHCHIAVDRLDFMDLAKADNFRILTVNTDASKNPGIEEQEQFALNQIKANPDRLSYLTTFSIKGWDQPDWQEKTIARLDSSFKKGAIGVKVWKNIGMVEKDKDGNFIMIDNARFDPIFEYIEKKGKPVCGHLGEPRNCWLPLEQMTVNNDKRYFAERPEYHMFLHPEFPSYEEQINARDSLLSKHPTLRFMGAHLGSLEWSIDELARHFDKYPNMTVDLAARICHIQKQAQNDRNKVREFFIKYQDRFIYGTDQGDYDGADPDAEIMKAKTHEVWTRDWKYFTSDEVMTSWEVDGEFKGLKLPADVIDKIYYKNAVKGFPGI